MEQWRPKFEHQVSRDLRVHLAFFSLFVALRYAASASQPPPSAFNSATLLGRPAAPFSAFTVSLSYGKRTAKIYDLLKKTI